MKANTSKQRRVTYRALYVVCYALMYPFVFLGAVGSRVWGERYRSNKSSNRHIFDETTARLNATLPWIYYV